MTDDGTVKVAPWPKVDFTAFGEVETVPISRIQSLMSAYMARNWALIPHVTHQDEIDITAIEAHRQRVNAAHPEVKVTALAYYMKACARVLKEFPKFNSSLDLSSGTLVYKKYVHIGFACDTPNGLVVPVVRDCDVKSPAAIAADIARLSGKAREKGVALAEMSGGCFTVSSLGAAGGTGFTPIINAPEVAILGVSRLIERPIKGAGGAVEWRWMVPLSLSYDHRVLNGVEASRFMTRLGDLLSAPSALEG